MQLRHIRDNAHQGSCLQSKMAYIVVIFGGLIVVINDKSMKIGMQGKFCMFISKQPEAMLCFARYGHKLQYKMAAIEILNFAYYFNLSAQKRVRHVFWHFHRWETYWWYWWHFWNPRWLPKLGF